MLVSPSSHCNLSASHSPLSLTVTVTLRLTMGSSGHGPALLSPAPGRCTDISSRDNFWSERDRPGSPRSRGEQGTTRKRGFWRRCCWKYSDNMNDEVIWFFQISLNDSVFLLIMGGATNSLTRQHKIYFQMCCKWLPCCSTPSVKPWDPTASNTFYCRRDNLSKIRVKSSFTLTFERATSQPPLCH